MAVTDPIQRCTPYRCWDIQLLPEGRDLQRWRHEAAVAVDEWGFDEHVRNDVVLGVSELLTNVLRHAGDRHCVLELREVGAAVFVRVTDPCSTLPVIKEPDDWTVTSGRGLWMLRGAVRALDWFSDPRRFGTGKTVWFQVSADRSPSPGSRAIAAVYRIESVAYLWQPNSDGSRLMALGDWSADDPTVAVGTLVARAGQVAIDLKEQDPSAADALHEWISTEAGSAGTLERLRRGEPVSCVAEGVEAIYEFVARPVPLPSTYPQVVPSCA
jgi:serine/threonine-protein kinase RsbW